MPQTPMNAGLPQSQRSSGTTRVIVNAYSTSGAAAPNFDINAASTNGARELLSGALTANVLKTLLSVNQAGQMPFLTLYAKNATSRTMRAVVIADGVVVFNSTTPAVVAANRGYPIVGSVIGVPGGSSYTPVQGPPIRWAQSLVIQVASSLTETDNVAIAYALN